MERLEASVNFSTKNWENLTKVLDVLLQEDFSVLIYRDEFGHNILKAIHNVFDEAKFVLIGVDEDLYTWQEVRDIVNEKENEKTYTLKQLFEDFEKKEDK